MISIEGDSFHPVQVKPQNFFENLFNENDESLGFKKYIYDYNKSRRFGKLEQDEKNLFQILEGFGIGSRQNECNLELPIDNCFENLYLEIDWAQIKFQRNWIDYIFLEEMINSLYAQDQLSEENRLQIQNLCPSKISIGAIIVKNILIKGFSKKRAVEFLLKNLTQTDESFFALNFQVSQSEDNQNNQNFELTFDDGYQIKLKQPRLFGYITKNLRYASENQTEEQSDEEIIIEIQNQPIFEEKILYPQQIQKISNQIEQLLKEKIEIPEILEYFRKFKDIREISNWEEIINDILNEKKIELQDTGENQLLPQISNYEQKQILKKKLRENQVKENIPDQLLGDYKGLSKEDISIYLKYFQRHRCITNRLEDLFPQEQEECIQILRKITAQQLDLQKVQSETFVHKKILEELYEKRFDEFINENTIINGFIEHYNTLSQIDLAYMLNEKNHELIERLKQIFKKNGCDYLKIIDACKKNTFAEFLLENQIENFLKAFQENNKSKYQEILRKLQNSDPVLCLKIVNSVQYFKQQYSKKVNGFYIDIENYESIRVYGNIFRAITKCDILQLDLMTKNITINQFKQYEERRLFYNADSKIKQQFIDEFVKINERERDIKNAEQNYLKLFPKYKDLKLQSSDFNFIRQYLNEEQIFEMNLSQNISQQYNRTEIEELSKKLDKQIILHKYQDLSQNETYGEKTENQLIQLAFNDEDSCFYLLIPDIVEFNTDQTDSSKLKKKCPEILENIAQWMVNFLGTKKLIDFIYNKQDDSQIYENIETLKDISQKYYKFQYDPTEQNFRMSLNFLKKLQDKNNELFEEWFQLIQHQSVQGIKFAEMYNFAKARTSIQHLISIKQNIKSFFPNSDKIFTLEDFNRICGKIDKNQQYQRLQNIKNNPQSFVQEVIKQMFGYFNRRENLSSFLQDLKSLELPIQISSRFLLNFVLQNSDIELRSRLIQYQSEYFSVPLIMQNQQDIQDLSKQSIVVPEIAFEMLDGSGILNLGVGLTSINPIGKTQILNDTLFPSHEINHEAFEQQDRNLFSYQQVDVFFEKSFEVKRNIIIMDVQGTISDSILKNILTLTNIAIIHFSQQDMKDQTQVNDLKNKIKTIKSSIDCQVILIIRDSQESKTIKTMQNQKFSEQYKELVDVESKIDFCFQIKNMTGQGKNDRILLLKDFQILFNTLIERLKGDKPKHKFTKQNFLGKFLSFYEKDNENINVVKDIVNQQQKFLKMVEQIKGNIFDSNGLPVLALKRSIRKIQIQIKQNQKSQNKNIDPEFEYKQEIQKKALEQQIQTINPSPILQLFYQIVMDKHSELILKEIEKHLKIVTQEMIKQPRQEKINLIEEQKKQSEKKESSTREDIDKRLQEYKEKIENINEEIYKKSVSLEYFWRNLIFYLGKETNFAKWNNKNEKKKVLNKIENHLMKGDCFELIEGENLDFKGYFIKEVIGSSQNENVIVVCVIGPQSSGKSTLMNSALGCQFGTGSGRCTIGVYFTLQRFPDDNKNGVKWLLMLDTEGLQSPERIDDEYDRKIVLFAMLSSDILIINNKGEINANMINTLKMCTMTFDQIKKPGYNPEIYYIFGQNDDQNMQPFVKQVLDLKSDLIESCDSETINKTSDEILGYRDDKINVLGFAYKNEAIEKDDNKGLKYDNSFKISISNFGVETSKIYQIIQNYVNNPDKRFNQISSWIENQKNSWEVIDKFSEDICAFSNLEEYKNDKKVKKFLDQKYQDYLITKNIKENDKKKSEQIKIKLTELLKTEGEQAMQKEIETAELEYNKEKDMDFQNFILSSFDDWKQLSDQKGVTIQSEKKHKSEIQSKIDFLKNQFIVKLKSNMKEEQVKYLREKGNKQIKELAQSILKDDNIMSLNQKEKEILITNKFEELWEKQQDEFKAQDQIDQMKSSYFNSIQISFRNINNFIETYGDVQYKQLQNKIDKALQKNNQNGLVSLIADELKNPQWHLHHEDLHQRIFNSDEQLIQQNKNSLGNLINNIEGEEVFLNLKKYFKSSYLFRYSLDPSADLKIKELEKDMNINLNLKKQQQSNQINSSKNKNQQNQMETVNDFEYQIKYLQQLLHDFEQAGFVIQVKKSAMFGFSSKLEDQMLSQLNVQDIIQSFGTDRNRIKKIQEWISTNFISQMKFSTSMKNKIEVNNRIEKYLNFKQLSIDTQNNKSVQDYISGNSELNKAKIVQKPVTKLQMNAQVQDKQLKDSLEAILDLKFQDNSFLQIQNSLFYVAYKSLDFNRISQTIIDLVQSILNQNRKQIEKENAGIVKILEANQITAQQMQDLEKNHLELKIKSKIQNELKSKLGIELNHQMNGKITQCAMIICWAELSKKAQDYQDQQLFQFQKYKIDNFNIFKHSILGNNDITTQKNTDKLIEKAFLDYFQNQKLLQQQQASQYLNSLKEEFEGLKVYEHLDNFYFSLRGQADDEEIIQYIQDPASIFVKKIQEMTKQKIENKFKIQSHEAEHKTLENIQVLMKIVMILNIALESNFVDWQQITLEDYFNVYDSSGQLVSYQQKYDLKDQIHPLILQLLEKILSGDFSMTDHFNLQVNKQKFKFVPQDKSDNGPLFLFSDENLKKQIKQLLENNQFTDFVQQLNSNLQNQKKEIQIFKIDLIIKQMKVKLQSLNNQMDTSQMQEDDQIQSSLIENNEINLDRKKQDHAIYQVNLSIFEDFINDLQTQALGCKATCRFCNRKCELQVHDSGTKHSCHTMGHQLRIFGQGHFVQDDETKLPALLSCQNISLNQQVKIKEEVYTWTEAQIKFQDNWDIQILQGEQELKKKIEIFSNFWTHFGQKYCSIDNYKYVEKQSTEQIENKLFILAIKQSSGSMAGNKWRNANQATQDFIDYILQTKQNQDSVHFMLIYFNQHYELKLDQNLSEPLPEWKKNQPDGAGIDFGLLFSKITEKLSQTIADFHNVQMFIYTDTSQNFPRDEMIKLQTLMENKRKDFKYQNKNKLKFVMMHAEKDQEVQIVKEIDGKTTQTPKSYYAIYQHLNKNSKDLFGHENTVLIQGVKTEEILERIKENFEVKEKQIPLIETFNF